MQNFNVFRILFWAIFNRIMDSLPSFIKDKRAVTGAAIGLVVTLVALCIIIPIGVLVTSNLSTSLDVVTAKSNVTTTAQNVTYDVFQNIWTSFSLSALVPIIAVAGVLIAIIIGAFMIRAKR